MSSHRSRVLLLILAAAALLGRCASWQFTPYDGRPFCDLAGVSTPPTGAVSPAVSSVGPQKAGSAPVVSAGSARGGGWLALELDLDGRLDERVERDAVERVVAGTRQDDRRRGSAVVFEDDADPELPVGRRMTSSRAA
jgi:hypothetical protein